MEDIKRNRRRARVNLTKIGEQIEAEANRDNPDENFILGLVQELDLTNTAVVSYNKQMEEIFTTTPVSEKEEDDEIEEVREFQNKYLRARSKAMPYIEAEMAKQRSDELMVTKNEPNGEGKQYDTHQMYTLPKVEVPVFVGEHRQWIKWWSQFKRIHDDDRLSGAEKFNLLLQGIKEGTRARELIDKYHVSDANYPKVIEALEERYGDTETLIDIYVRDLQMLMIKNIMSKNDRNAPKISARKLYDDISASMNALNSLGGFDKSMYLFLFPTIESSLPHRLMISWQESAYSKPDPVETGTIPRNKLERIMAFLKEAARNEYRRELAAEGFKFNDEKPKPKDEAKPSHRDKFRKGFQKKEKDTPAVMGLVAMNANSCIFCGKHPKSHNCRTAANWKKDDKDRKIKEAGACWKCFEKGHRSKDCEKEIKCSKCELTGHYAIMCPGPAQGNYNQVPPPPQPPVQNNMQLPPGQRLFPIPPPNPSAGLPQGRIELTNFNVTPDVLLPTLMVGCKGLDGKRHLLRGAFDTMSGHSYMRTRAIKAMGFKPFKTETFKHAVFGGGTRVVLHGKYQIELSALDWNYSLNVEVYDQDQIASGIPAIPSEETRRELQQYGIQLTDSHATEIDILIGADIISTIMTGNQFRLSSGLMAIQTNFGWTVMGRDLRPTEKRSQVVEQTLVNFTYPNCLWELEAIGIEDNAQKLSKAEEDVIAMEHFRKTVTRKEDGRYEVALPWIEGHPPLPSNIENAEKRLNSATKKLFANDKYPDYDAVFEEWLQEGIISEIIDDTLEDVHLLPHKPVFKKDSKTTKTRPVFDASCRTIIFEKGNKRRELPSLNDCTVKGPNLLDEIPNHLLRFMEGPVAASADIRKAFLMILIREADRKKLRFLWWKYVMQGIRRVFQHNRVVFGVNCSPFLLNAVIDHHLESDDCKGFEDTVAKLKKSKYVDNVIPSFPDTQAYEKFKKESVELLAKAKFDPRLWESNVDEEIGPEPTGILGIKWDRLRDQLYCDVLPDPDFGKVTKKTILSAIARVYDPLGMLAPVVLQRCWDLKLQWGEEVPVDIKDSFEQWLSEMKYCTSARIPRYIGVPTEGSSLHVFCDASFSGYAAVVYLRLVEADKVSVKYVMCRSRVSPLKKTTINRLELVGCEIATRLGETVKNALEWHHVPTYYWTDSTTAIAWIKRDKDWGTFVGNRVKKIRQVTKKKKEKVSGIDDWHHVPGKMNPADLPSRGCGMIELIQKKWLQGPQWLVQEPEYWPGGDMFYDEDAINKEAKKTELVMCNLPADAPWYSTWRCRLGGFRDIVRMIGWMLRYKFNCQSRRKKLERIRGELTFEEIRKAESRLFYLIQQESNLDPKNLPFQTTKFEEDELLRVETKLLFREDTRDFKFPVILSGKHYLTELLIRQEHLINHHAGVQFLLANLRERVWIVGGRRAISNVIQNCYICRRFTGRHLDPVTAPLPENRIRDASPFEITGIDFAGPLYLKGKKKTWVALFTCAVFRAVHLELVDHMDADTILLSLRKFIARRGRPSVIYTDNGTNFVGASNMLKEVDWNRIASDPNCLPIKWHFNPPSAPWWGGWFERLVRSMKELLVRNLGLEVLTKEELSAVLCDVEATINGRPLTYVYESDAFIPLTPALFLYGPRGQGVPDLDQLDCENVNRRLRIRQELMENLRERFRKEYLGQLVQRRQEVKDVELRVGDVVLVGSENVKRSMWPMAVVKEVIDSEDGEKRLFRLRTKNGELLRAAQRLYPLELTKSYVEKAPPKVQEVIKTRAGRVVKPPKKFQ